MAERLSGDGWAAVQAAVDAKEAERLRWHRESRDQWAREQAELQAWHDWRRGKRVALASVGAWAFAAGALFGGACAWMLA